MSVILSKTMGEGKLRGVGETRLARSQYLLGWVMSTWGVITLFYFCICLKMTKTNCLKIALSEDISKRLGILENPVSDLDHCSGNSPIT